MPSATLLAYQHLESSNVAVSDQTVWEISSYHKGYFFGVAYPSLNGVPVSSSNLIGSVTPEGAVYITFYPTSGSLSENDVVVGIGKLIRVKGKPMFVMQMSSSQNATSGLSHWSLMVEAASGSPLYQNLPGVHMSVPEYIAQF